MLSELWRLVETDIPDCLVIPVFRRAIEHFTEGLPIEGHLGLELHLHDAERAPDLSQVFSPTTARTLVEQQAGIGLAAPGAVTRDHLRWLVSDPAITESIRLLWLEWDADVFEREDPTPSVFLEPSETAGEPAWKSVLENPAGHGMPDYVTALPGDLLSTLAESGVKPGIVGTMVSRHPAPGRLYLSSPRLSDAIAAWRKLGVSDLDDATLRQLTRFEASGIRIRPNLDVLEGTLGSRIGLDLAWPGSGDLRLPHILVEWLKEQPGVDPAAVEGLSAFPHVWTPVDAHWPEAYLLASLQQPEDRFSQVTGYLHHLKLVFEGAALREIKAYLGFAHQLVTPGDSGTPRGASDNPG